MTSPSDDADWRERILTDTGEIRALLRTVKRMAVLGIRSQPDHPAHEIPAYAQRAGITIIPVPVYEPDATVMLGQPVVRCVADAPPPIDLVNVFRRPADIPAHLDDMIAAKPRAVWFQKGIRNDEAADELARAGIVVVQDRCVEVELRAVER